MIRLFSRPGVLTSAVVAASVVSGVAFGAVAVTAALALRMAMRSMGKPR